MKAIFCLLIIGSNSLATDALLSWLLGGKNDKKCAEAPTCVGGACYRNFDGSCNNVNVPSTGMAGMPYARLCEDCYSNDKSGFPKSKSGKPLPNARRISTALSPEKDINDYECTMLLSVYGQLFAHDIASASGVGQINMHLVSCCDRDKNILTKLLSDSRCAAILIPHDDPVYNSEETPCLQLARTLNTNDKKCHSPYKSYTPISDVTSWIDCSMVYGNSDSEHKTLRDSSGGRLKADIMNGQEWPSRHPNPSDVCSGQAETGHCFLTGDARANQSPQLTELQVIFFREHNRLCKELSILNPAWDDEKLFQAARRILIAIFQHITYTVYLVIILGLDVAVKKKLVYPGVKGYVTDYNSEIIPNVLVEFSSAAFRLYHSMSHGEVEMYNEDRQVTNSIFMRDTFNAPTMIVEGDNFGSLCLGLVTQDSRATDQYIDDDFNQLLFKEENDFGSDLRSLDIQRSRDHGVCTYVNIRKACGLPVPTSIDDLVNFGVSKENVNKIKILYEDVSDLEAGVIIPLETSIPDSRAGPTASCIIAQQFLNSRVSDRYFYQNDHKSGFTLEQLESIQDGALMSRLLCDHGQVQSIQLDAFHKPSAENPILSCDEIPRLDLQPWIDSKC